MLPSPALYFTFLAVCAAALALVSFRSDRILGWVVVFALCVNFTGASLMGWWAQRMHGREYTAGDEVGYQWDAERMLTAWRTGDTSYVRSTVGIYAPINAAVMVVAGPGQKPMRLTTAFVGAAGVAAAFWFAMLLYGSVATARVAAALCATSPLLILFAWTNLRDRWIGTGSLLVLIAATLTIQRPTWRRVVALMVSVWFHAEVRHYWATLLGYLAIGGSLLFGAPRWPRRIANTAVVTLAVGFALWIVTQTFLGIGIRHETVVKYVAVPEVASPPASAGPAAPPVAPTAAANSAAPPSVAAGSPAPGPAGPPVAPTAAANSTAPPSVTAGSPTPGTGGPTPPTSPASMASIPAAPPGDQRQIPYSGPTLGEAQGATRPDSLRALLKNLAFVLFGRVHARPDGGQFASVFLLPEALWSILLLPLAAVGVVVAIGRSHFAVLIPAAYVGVIMAVLTWLRGDDWNTYRFRSLYWPVLLILVAGGVSRTYEWWVTRRGTSRATPSRIEPPAGAPDAAHT